MYVWRYDADTRPSRSNSVVNVSQSYEHFHCLGVTVAVPWPNTSSRLEGISLSLEVKEDNRICLSGTWPEEKLSSSYGKNSLHSSGDLSNGDSVLQSRLAWGMVIVTASRGGVIRIYQNYGLPVRV